MREREKEGRGDTRVRFLCLPPFKHRLDKSFRSVKMNSAHRQTQRGQRGLAHRLSFRQRWLSSVSGLCLCSLLLHPKKVMQREGNLQTHTSMPLHSEEFSLFFFFFMYSPVCVVLQPVCAPPVLNDYNSMKKCIKTALVFFLHCVFSPRTSVSKTVLDFF